MKSFRFRSLVSLLFLLSFLLVSASCGQSDISYEAIVYCGTDSYLMVSTDKQTTETLASLFDASSYVELETEPDSVDFVDFLLVVLETESGERTVRLFRDGYGRLDDNRLVKFKTNAYETVKTMFENSKQEGNNK